MVPTNDISVFIERNDSEFREQVKKQCAYLNYQGSSDDIIQELYFQFLTTNQTIEAFDESRGIKISTYLFKVIQNFIISKIRERYNRDRVRLSKDTENNKTDLKDAINIFERLFPSSPDNIRFAFSRKSNKKKVTYRLRILYKLKKRGDIGVEYEEIRRLIINTCTYGCTLYDLYNLLYKGYTNEQISEIYGVSRTTISTLKRRLAKIMVKYGLLILK